jgi:predicted transcriptional regulator
VRRLVDRLFDGSPELLLTHLVSDRKMKRADIQRLREALDARLEDDTKP